MAKYYDTSIQKQANKLVVISLFIVAAGCCLGAGEYRIWQRKSVRNNCSTAGCYLEVRDYYIPKKIFH